MPPAPMRLPAASTPMSFIVTPPSFSAARAASAPRSTMSLSGYLPNLVMWIPRIQTSSAIRCSLGDRAEAVAHGFGALGINTNRGGRELDLHAEADVLGRRLDVDDVAAHARAVAVDDGRDERHRNAGRGHRHDRERLDDAARLDRHLLPLVVLTAGAGVAAVEEASPALRALVGHEVW